MGPGRFKVSSTFTQHLRRTLGTPPGRPCPEAQRQKGWTTVRHKAEQVIIVAEGRGGRRTVASLELSHRILPTGEAVAGIAGELDIATADRAVSYLTQVIDRHHGPVIVNLTALRFCDARGLSALLQIARYAKQGGHKFTVASPSPSLVKLLRLTALDRKLLGATGPRPKRILSIHGARPAIEVHG
jgi:anti-anti-sigma factor